MKNFISVIKFAFQSISEKFSMKVILLIGLRKFLLSMKC